MVSVTLKEFVASNEIKAISKVRKNKNGYPFVTLISDKFEGGGENIYFSIKAAKDVEEGDDASSIIHLKLHTVENADGETRVKLGKSSGEDYTSVEELGLV